MTAFIKMHRRTYLGSVVSQAALHMFAVFPEHQAARPEEWCSDEITVECSQHLDVTSTIERVVCRFGSGDLLTLLNLSDPWTTFIFTLLRVWIQGVHV